MDSRVIALIVMVVFFTSMVELAYIVYQTQCENFTTPQLECHGDNIIDIRVFLD